MLYYNDALLKYRSTVTVYYYKTFMGRARIVCAAHPERGVRRLWGRTGGGRRAGKLFGSEKQPDRDLIRV